MDHARVARALLVNGEIVGAWRRSNSEVSINAWHPLSSAEREAVEAEAVSLPLPGGRRFDCGSLELTLRRGRAFQYAGF